VREDIRDIKQRMTTLETTVGHLASDEANRYAQTATRADRVDARLERIERRCNLADA
jgi:hypothetical protein